MQSEPESPKPADEMRAPAEWNRPPPKAKPNETSFESSATLTRPALYIVGTYLSIGTLLFSALEGWGLSTSIYFCVITLTTVGYGDVVPKTSGGKVVKAEKHPDADKLKVCQVATAGGETQIICGAPNAREGITVVIASPGVYVPGIDTTIQVGKIRGIESHGMMCSTKEIEAGEDHDGIADGNHDSQKDSKNDDHHCNYS
mgnify:CR=1 FL=1